VIGITVQDGRTLAARSEPDSQGQWQVLARSEEGVLPDAVPVIVDLDGHGDGGHVAVLAGPDRHRYPHAMLGDDTEAREPAAAELWAVHAPHIGGVLHRYRAAGAGLTA